MISDAQSARRFGRTLMKLLRFVFILSSIATGSLPALATGAPFMESARFLTEAEEWRLLDRAELARLAAIRSRKQVIQATTGACDRSAFSSASIKMDLPNGRSVVLLKTRQESTQFPSSDEHGTRMVTARSWIGRTDVGTDVIFSFVDGSMSGQFDEVGEVVNVEQLNTRFCIIIQYDSSKSPLPG